MSAGRSYVSLLPPLLLAAAAAILTGAPATPGVTASADTVRTDTFPHEKHEGLFPLCQGCHAGIETGTESAYYPTPADCATCHDGTLEPKVAWTTPKRTPTNLAFSHEEHIAQVAAAGDPPSACTTCHRREGPDTLRMNVGPASPDACLGCHAHEASSHLAPGRDCTVCHVPLTKATGLSAAQIADFPEPASHDTAGFVLGHAPASSDASCAVCHARESCARCHLNADALAPVRALASDPRVAALTRGRAPEYPTPPSHEGGSWVWGGHGPEAEKEAASGCGSCHTVADCATCHRDGSLPVAAALPTAPKDDLRGVGLKASDERVHGPDWVRGHGPDASSRGETCATCHQSDFCTSCHQGPTAPSFHLPDFMDQHASEAYGNESDCATCHNAQTFCRACHQNIGLASEGRPDVAFHTSRPVWLLGHGVAARQGLQGCITCHTQSDCATCHSAVGGWGVSPHGPDFDAERAREANPFSCAHCHLDGVGP